MGLWRSRLAAALRNLRARPCEASTSRAASARSGCATGREGGDKPAAALAGAILLVWADVAARTLAAPEDLPIGIVTALFGSLFFVVRLRRC
ncbi:hypothetical protein WT97_22120 [Burkholderia sp. MSMB1459WGS]|nr:hypothetical protein WT97_22120 [Burkholderia sp. MSMB1459WGS]